MKGPLPPVKATVGACHQCLSDGDAEEPSARGSRGGRRQPPHDGHPEDVVRELTAQQLGRRASRRLERDSEVLPVRLDAERPRGGERSERLFDCFSRVQLAVQIDGEILSVAARPRQFKKIEFASAPQALKVIS